MQHDGRTCLCAICRKAIVARDFETGAVADHKVFDFDGELDYIELAHKSCATTVDPNGFTWKWDT